jgi:hypothetical protein
MATMTRNQQTMALAHHIPELWLLWLVDFPAATELMTPEGFKDEQPHLPWNSPAS